MVYPIYIESCIPKKVKLYTNFSFHVTTRASITYVLDVAVFRGLLRNKSVCTDEEHLLYHKSSFKSRRMYVIGQFVLV